MGDDTDPDDRLRWEQLRLPDVGTITVNEGAGTEPEEDPSTARGHHAITNHHDP